MTKRRVFRWFFGVVATVLACFAALYIWAYWPIYADIDARDPAVSLANELTVNDIEYVEGFVESRGHQIHYVTAGQGEPIVFLHGFPSYWFTMFGLMEEFGAGHQVIAIDGLGVGKSDGPTEVGEYEIEGLAQDVAAVVDHLGIDDFHLVGHDWGAAVATGFAVANPERVKTLTAIGAMPYNILLSRLRTDAEHREIFSYISYFKSANPVTIRLFGAREQIWSDIFAPMEESGLISARYAERLRQDIGHARRTDRLINWYRANFPEFDTIQESDFWPEPQTRLTVPSLFIYGSDDQVVTQAMIADFEAMSDSLRVLRFESTGHRPHFEHREEVSTAIRELITGNEGETSNPTARETAEIQ